MSSLAYQENGSLNFIEDDLDVLNPDVFSSLSREWVAVVLGSTSFHAYAFLYLDGSMPPLNAAFSLFSFSSLYFVSHKL